jgi:hypothetical protein
MPMVDFIEKFCRENLVLQKCIQGFYNLLIGLAIAIAFLFIIIGSLQYLLGAAINTKEEGKKKITGAVIGLIVIFVNGVILYWINPNIFKAELIIYRIQTLKPPQFSVTELGGGPFAPTTLPDSASRTNACNRGQNIGTITYNTKQYVLMATKYYVPKESQRIFVNGSFKREVEINGSGYCDIGQVWLCRGNQGKYVTYTHRISNGILDACNKTPIRDKTVAIPQQLHPGIISIDNKEYHGTDTGSAILLCEEQRIIRIDFFSGIGYEEYRRFQPPTGSFTYQPVSNCNSFTQ